jgi:hypothetical protein
MRFKIELLPIQKKLYYSDKMYAGIWSSRATGKTYILSWLITLAIIQGKKCLAFSQTSDSLKQNLFNEVLQRFRELGIEPVYNQVSRMISFNGGQVLGYTYENTENVRGQTNIEYLFLDELALAPSDLLAIVGPCMRGENIKPKIRFCSTPRMGSYWNRIVRDHMRVGDWDVFTGTYKENTKLSAESITLIESSVVDPLMRQQELEGTIIETVVENCILNGIKMSNYCKGKDSNYVMGVDVARFGNDSTVIVIRDSYHIVEKIPLFHADTYTVSNKIEEMLRKYRIQKVYLDGTGGFSSGIEDYLKLGHNNIVSVNFGGKSSDPNNLNTRADIYTNLVKAIDDGFFIDDSEMLDELNATSYIILQSGKKAIVPKDKIKEILGHSPDVLDALALTFYPDMTIDRATEQKYMNMFFR